MLVFFAVKGIKKVKCDLLFLYSVMELSKMRRKDRQVSEIEGIKEVISKADVIRIGLIDGNEPYIVPLNFGFEVLDEVFVFYMHCANEGRKLDIISVNPLCCFELDIEHKLSTAEQACGWSMSFKSVMGIGNIEIVNEVSAKIHGLRVLMQQYDNTAQPQYDFSKLLDKTTVLKITGKTISCKIKE